MHALSLRLPKAIASTTLEHRATDPYTLGSIAIELCFTLQKLLLLSLKYTRSQDKVALPRNGGAFDILWQLLETPAADRSSRASRQRKQQTEQTEQTTQQNKQSKHRKRRQGRTSCGKQLQEAEPAAAE